ncbi:MAG: ABC-F family ATP-binding cassette domain-containing protein [Saprospiraceae bacterium]|nr:ABC-F family ATP-binding cassette domain-containing protein [Candidatus Defluviibacterium haderslevense]MBK8243479.1 ABC-F family ATP-binding cassette domain-containing protein [Candidatus Defluviibacterium haderslevense]
MNYLTLENVTRSYGDKVLFEKINLTINEGDKIALIARNGSGKSSLLRILSGEEPVEGEQAKYWINKEIRCTYLAQDPDFEPGHNILETILEGNEEWIKPLQAMQHANESHDDAEIQKALAIMDEYKAWEMDAYVRELIGKFKLPDFDFKVSNLSGGQKKRLAIVKVLCVKPDFIILDEPTNHLDLEMIEWLEKYLEQSQITLIMVTHDRYFLNNVANQILELDRGELFKYQGDYEDFLIKKDARIQNEAIGKSKLTKMLRKELEWVVRMPKARTTKSKSRMDAYFTAKESLQGPQEPGEVEFEIDHTRLGSKILELHHIHKSFGDLKIIENFSYKFKLGDRVGLVGPNGTGKTTLLHLFTGQIKPDQGKIILGDTVLLGYYKQDGLILKEDRRVIDVIRDIADYIPLKKGHKLSAESLLERFLFPRSQQQVYASQLSGGERRRLYLLTILIKNPNFLILDEPTNDLDIITLNVLEDFLMDFPGVLLIVSHDRFFMDRLVDHLFVLEGNGQIRDFPGNYTDYREALKAESIQDKKDAKEEKNNPDTEIIQVKKLAQVEKKEMQQIERELDKLSHERDKIMDLFLQGNLSYEEIAIKNKRLEEIHASIQLKEARWMELG